MNLIRCYASAVLVCSTLACGGSSNLPSSDKLVKEEVGKESSLEVVSRLLENFLIKVDDYEGVAERAKWKAATADDMTEAEIEAEWATEPEMIIARYFSDRFRTEELRQIAEAGVAWAQYNLAQRYYAGVQHLQDFERGEYWMLLAAEQGYGQAMHDLMSARYGASDRSHWARRLADQGAAADTYEVAGMYYRGRPPLLDDKVEGLRLYQLAAEKGSHEAMRTLGLIYWTETSDFAPPDGDKNNVLAYMWFNLTNSRGGSLSKEQRDRVADLLSPAEILEGQRLAREWDEVHPELPRERQRLGVRSGRSRVKLSWNTPVPSYSPRR